MNGDCKTIVVYGAEGSPKPYRRILGLQVEVTQNTGESSYKNAIFNNFQSNFGLTTITTTASRQN